MAETVRACLCTSLEKIFPTDEVHDTGTLRFSMLQNEKKSFQLAMRAGKGAEIAWETQSPLSPYCRAFFVRMIPVGLNAPKKSDDFYISKNKTEYPDLLTPLSENRCTAEYDGQNVIWFEIGGEQLPAGKHELKFSVRVGESEPAVCRAEIEVLPVSLPKQTLVYTNWFHTDCLMRHYGFEAFSDEYWRVTENFLRTAHEYGMNCVLTPLFTPPLDTKVGGERPTVQLVDVTVTGKDTYAFGFDKLKTWVEMCRRCGIEYFEMSHFFTQWGAKHAPKIMAKKDGAVVQIFGWKTRAAGKAYRRFLAQFAKALIAVIDELGLRKQCIFHVSDEPNVGQIRTYKKAARIVHENFGDFKIIDALSDYKLYAKGLIQTPVPANDHIEKFIGKVPELWTYYCCVQADSYVSNRFFSMPSLRNRVLGLQLYKYNVKGFLHWGYNFYFSRFSVRQIDPFQVTDADNAFSSGDSFVVYPGKDGSPLLSLRLPVFYDGLQDMRALQLLESLAGREKTMQILEEGLKEPLTFSCYRHEDAWLLDLRERVNRAIMQYTAEK